MIWVTAGHEVESKVGLLFFTISLVVCILTHRDPGYIEWPISIQSPTSLSVCWLTVTQVIQNDPYQYRAQPPFARWTHRDLLIKNGPLPALRDYMYRSCHNCPDGSCATVRKLLYTFLRPGDMYTISRRKIKGGGGGSEIWRFDLYLRGWYNTWQLYCLCVEKFAFWLDIFP